MHRSWVAMKLAVALVVLWVPEAVAEDGPMSLMRLGHLRRAAAAAETRIATKPDDVEALCVLARVRAQQKRFDEATKLAERAVAADPNSPDAHYALGLVAGTKAQFSSVLKQPGLAGKFKKEAEKALAIDPNHEEAIGGLVEFYRRAPGIMGGDKKKSAEFADRLMQVNATVGWLLKADLAFDDKDTVVAERALRSAVAVKGEPRAKVSLANWLVASWRKPDEAERLAREAIDAEPVRTGGWAVLASRQAQQKRWTELDATLAGASSAIPWNLGPHYQAARVIISEKTDPARAEALLRRYLEVEPEIGYPTHAGAHWRLGQALEQLGRKPEAIAEMQTALKMDPSLEGAKRDLKRLKQ